MRRGKAALVLEERMLWLLNKKSSLIANKTQIEDDIFKLDVAVDELKRVLDFLGGPKNDKNRRNAYANSAHCTKNAMETGHTSNSTG